MTNKRPPYILAHPADNFGCGHHRMVRPLEVFTGLGVAAGRADINIWPSEFLQALGPDVVVWQRQHEEGQIENMKRYREALPNAFFVYELDDALSAVPEASFHRPFIPVDVDARMARAIEHVDVVTVSTQALKNHMRGVIGGDKPIRVIPNMLSKEDFETAESIRKQTTAPHQQLRVGWGGGVSHKGDLDIIVPLIEAFGGHVEFVFLGMKPDTPHPVEFHLGVAPRDYLQKLASLNLDLMIAPIEDNLFNRCKSNLRLIEAGACGYPVLASPVEPYLELSPPVFGYAEPTADAWIEKLRAFIETPADERRKHGEALAAWARRNFSMTDRGEERLKGWLPSNAKVFRPKLRAPAKTLTIVCATPNPGLSAFGHVVPTMREALDSSGDILWLKQNIAILPDTVRRMQAHMKKERVGSVVPLSNDGGVAGFPSPGMFKPLDPTRGADLDKLASAMLADIDMKIQFPIGPAILMSRQAIDAVGAPEVIGVGIEQMTIIEWASMIAARNFHNVVATDCFVTAMEAHDPQMLQFGAQRSQMRWPPVTMEADPLADARERLEIAFHRDSYKSALPTEKPTYSEWCELFDTLSGRDLDAMKKSVAGFAQKPRFTIVLADDTTIVEEQCYPHIAVYSGDDLTDLLEDAAPDHWIIFARPNSHIRSHTTNLFAAAISSVQFGDASLVYGDHDHIDKDGVRSDHYFKTNYDQDAFLCHDYITQICAIRSTLVKGAGAVNASHVDVYRVALFVARASTRTAMLHVPRILCHLEPEAVANELATANIKAMVATGHIAERNWSGVVTSHPLTRKYNSVHWRAPETQPLVSIIIPTKDRVEMLSPCIATLLTMTTYKNFEILIVANNVTNPTMLDYLETFKAVNADPRVRLLQWNHDYNWSALNNFAAKQAKGDFFCLLNDDTRIISPEWLDEMVGAASREHVGAVGARLLYPNGLVQHVGVVAMNGLSGHIQKGTPDGAEGYHGYPLMSHECSAVTGACLLVSREKFEMAQGLDESLAHNFNDVAFCLELLTLGFTNVLAANANLQHLEGATRLSTLSREGMEILQRESKMVAERYPFPDVYWNQNLKVFHTHGGAMVQGLNSEMLSWPPAAWPWRGDDWATERVLVVGDDPETVRREAREGNMIYAMSADGLSAKIVHPPLDNVRTWDLRNPESARMTLELLGIRRIIVTSIDEGPIEILPFLTRLGVQVDFRPSTAIAVCPRGNFETPIGNCGEGWKRGCGTCIAQHGSPFGFVSVDGWRDTWKRFLTESDLIMSDLSPEARQAMEDVYG